AADPGSVRGTNYEEVYPLGVQVTVTGSQSQAMKNARENMSHLAEAGNYMDYYEYFEDVDGHPILIGLTFNVTDMMEDIKYGTFSGTTTAVIGQIVLSLICLILLYFFVLDPLMKILGNIREYTESKDSANIIANLRDVHPNNEIGELSDDITQLAQEMDDYYTKIETITKERERISTELDLASRIQASMLPSSFPAFPGRDEFDIFASMTPAKAVGGDFYDFYMIDDDHLCITMADVSGKGIPASLFMMISKIILKNHSMAGKSPSRILSDVNDANCDNNKEEMFVTIWLGILELSTGKLTYANAGHEYPAIRHAGGDYELVKGRHGFIVGGMPGLTYKEDSITLEPGSGIFLYTDGVPEATAGDGSMFGLDRMIDTLNGDPDASPEKVIERVRTEVDDFVKDAEQFDDITLMALTYKG
ncbi:MAG: PP2C family protein-serine/threonine phosphatase, partial [Firmicutes bacterium]|nr:PP2C family protein-serine/threonine phosphatase [Bacillota bacterium]